MYVATKVVYYRPYACLLKMFATDHLCLLIKCEDDPFYIGHIGYIV